MLTVENYNELDLFEFQSKLRTDLVKLLEPYIKQISEDRTYLMKMEKEVEDQKKHLTRLEDIIYQKSELEEMDLFAKIYNRINVNNKNSIVEDDKLNI